MNSPINFQFSTSSLYFFEITRRIRVVEFNESSMGKKNFVIKIAKVKRLIELKLLSSRQ